MFVLIGMSDVLFLDDTMDGEASRIGKCSCLWEAGLFVAYEPSTSDRFSAVGHPRYDYMWHSSGQGRKGQVFCFCLFLKHVWKSGCSLGWKCHSAHITHSLLCCPHHHLSWQQEGTWARSRERVFAAAIQWISGKQSCILCCCSVGQTQVQADREQCSLG